MLDHARHLIYAADVDLGQELEERRIIWVALTALDPQRVYSVLIRCLISMKMRAEQKQQSQTRFGCQRENTKENAEKQQQKSELTRIFPTA